MKVLSVVLLRWLHDGSQVIDRRTGCNFPESYGQDLEQLGSQQNEQIKEAEVQLVLKWVGEVEALKERARL